MSELTIPIPEITESPKRFALSTDDRWWGENRALFRDPETSQAGPILLDLDVYRLGRRLFFRGPVEGTLEIPCGRCLEPYPHRISDRVELLLEPIQSSEAQGPPEGGIELDPEDLEIGRYAGDELDFGVVLREILLFNWPMQPRCADDCRGLCSSCGMNRNREACRCSEDAVQRPFAALGQLLGRRRE